MSEILKLAKEALEKNELEKFLKGEGHYEVKPDFMVPVNVPTDWSKIVDRGIYKLYMEYPLKGIDKLFQETLIKMSTDTLELYASLSIFYIQLLRERDNRSPFKIKKDRIINELKKRLNENQEGLRKDFRWMGKNQPEGLWSEVGRMCKLITDKFGIDLI